jgi:hypothetical protein
MGVHPNFVLPTQILFFCDLNPNQKFSEPYDNPFWEKSEAERKREREKLL